MQTFYNLEQPKQEQIINGAMAVFATHGYHKSSMSEIARRSEVSKATLFYHFKTKLDLYLFLLDTATSEIGEALNNQLIDETNDFFEVLRFSTEYKMRALQKRPSLMRFLTKFYFEEAPELAAKKAEQIANSDNMRERLVFEDLDVSKFKETVDPAQVMDMLLKWTEGYIAILERSAESMDDQQIADFYEKLINDFLQLIEMLETNFYKPEYLSKERT